MTLELLGKKLCGRLETIIQKAKLPFESPSFPSLFQLYYLDFVVNSRRLHWNALDARDYTCFLALVGISWVFVRVRSKQTLTS